MSPIRANSNTAKKPTDIYIIIAASVGFCAFYFLLTSGMDGTMSWSWVKQYFYWPAVAALKAKILTPAFPIAITIILVLERLMPVHAKQKTFSMGLMRDGVWFILAMSLLNIGLY